MSSHDGKLLSVTTGEGGQTVGASGPLQDAQESHSNKNEAIDMKHSPVISGLEERVSNVQSRWDGIQAEVDRLPRYSSGWFYWPFMVLLTIGEVPLNRLSFELFFRESPLISLVVALLVGMVLIALAHRIGVVFARFRYNVDRGNLFSQLIQIAVFLGITGALIYGISVLRQGYLAYLTQPELGFSQLLANDQIGAVAMKALKVGLGSEGWIFLSVNAAIILVGVSAAYFCHDPHPDFEKIDREKNVLEKQLDEARNKLGLEKAKELRRHNNALNRIKGKQR